MTAGGMELFGDPGKGWFKQPCPHAQCGRCTIYETRPQLCRGLEPLWGPLCVHWRGAEGGEESVLR